ncbi:class I SAM-dependent methyltransferase [Micromonospora sp. DPT]|uniref:SAM-dependent methyltransferase n=1 Tax=Micromonospora sp. DPT TaxID=3142975 RepID=UPI00320AFB10
MQTTEGLAALRYARMRWNTPLSEQHAALLLQRLDIRPGTRVLDLGCGWGELLLRAVAAAEVREELDDRLREYVGVYRGVLGLAYFVLAAPA